MMDFAPHMEAVALALLGKPTSRTKTELRFGTRGSMAVDCDKGTWFDHEAGKGGGVLALIKREKGLANGSAVDWLRDELGIHLDAGSDRPKAKQQKQGQGRIVATYDYVDEHRELLSQTVRFEPKDFKQRRPNGNGGWIWSLGGVRRILYHLPELLAADPAEPVFVVEGEKHVDRLRDLGLVATTSPEGAGKWCKVDPVVRAVLTGRHVVALTDNDDPGRRHTAQIVRDLSGKAASVRVIELAGLPEKGDVINWLDAGGTVEELRRLATEAPEAQPEPGNWQDEHELICGKDGPRAIEANVATFLRHDPALKGRLRLNLMTAGPECASDLPWSRPDGCSTETIWREWTDTDDACLCEYVQHKRLMVSPPKCRTGVNIVAREREVHPVREYLEGLRWDCTERLSGWLEKYCHAEIEGATEAETKRRRRYVQAVSRKWPIAAVARACERGCKADHCLVLESPQGRKKSTAFETMAVRPEWYSSLASALGSKDAMQDLAGSWIVELEELASLRGKDVNRMKAYLSVRSDKYRDPYDRRSSRHPRSNVFAGSVNDAEYMTDDTGGRRFWPVKIGGMIDTEGLTAVRDQLWAEAFHAYKAREKWWLDEELETIAGDEQEERRIADPWHEAVVRYIDHVASKGQWVTVNELLTTAIGKPFGAVEKADQMRVGAILRKAGWAKRQHRIEKGGNPVTIWLPPGCKHLDDDPEEGIDGGAYGSKASNHAASEETVSTVNTVSTSSDKNAAGSGGCAGGVSGEGKHTVTGNGADGAYGAYGADKPLNGNGKGRTYPDPGGAYGASGKVLTGRFCRHCGELVDDRDRQVTTFGDGSLAHFACYDAQQ